MTLGENIVRLRTQKNWSQGDLADALEISRQSVSKWETDASIPELDKLLKLSELFGVTLDELVRGEDVPKTEPVPARHPRGKSAPQSLEQLYCVPVRSFWFSACCSPVICLRDCCSHHRSSSAASSALL